MKFDHIGIFVKQLDYGFKKFEELFKIAKASKIYNDQLLQVSVQFLYDCQNICYELVAPYGPKNPVDAVLKAGNNNLNHLAYKSPNFDIEVLRLRQRGCIPLGEAKPALAFSGARVIFFLIPLKLILELIEEVEK